MDQSLLDDLPNFKYLTFVRRFGKKVFFKLCELIFFEGRSKTIRSFFEQEYKVSFPKDIEENLDVETINESISKKIKELDSKQDFLIMSNIFQFLWKNGVKKPEERGLKEAMKILINEIKLVESDQFWSEKFTHAALSDKLEHFHTFLQRIIQDAKRSITHIDINFDHLKEEMKTGIENWLNVKIREAYDLSKPLEMVKFKHELISSSDEFDKITTRRVMKEITKSRGIWLAQNRVNYASNPIIPLNLEYDKVFHKEESNKRIKGGGFSSNDGFMNHNQILNVKYSNNGKYPSVIVVSGDAGVGKTTMLLDIVKKFDEEKSMQLNTLSTLDSSSFTEKLYKAKEMVAKKQQRIDFDSNHAGDVPHHLSSFEILLYIPMRNGDFDNFDDYLKNLLPHTLGKDGSYADLNDVRYALTQSKCLILCDGFDEANDKSQKLFEEMIEFNFQDCSRFIITTRPNKTIETVEIVDNARKDRIILNISHLQPRDMKILGEKIIDDYPANIDKNEVKSDLMTVIDGMKGGSSGGNGVALLDVLRNPLYFNRFVFSYITNPETRRIMKSVFKYPGGFYTYSNIMNLYLQLDAYKRQTIVEKIGIKSAALKEFNDLYLDFSLQNYKKKEDGKKYEIFEKDIDDIKSKIKSEEVKNNFNHIVSFYFNARCVSKGLDIETVYNYRYENELEFAAAQRICGIIMLFERERNRDDISTNIFERALVSSGIFEMWKGSLQSLRRSLWRESISETEIKLRKYEDGVCNFYGYIIGILYNAHKQLLYSNIDNIYKLIWLFGGERAFDFVLNPRIGIILLDDTFLNVWVELLTRKLKRSTICINQIDSFNTLRLILPKLDPAKCQIEIKISKIQPIRWEQLFLILDTVQSAIGRGFKNNNLEFSMNLKEIGLLSAFNGESIITVDKLNLFIHDDHDEHDQLVNYHKLYSFPISARKNLTITYNANKVIGIDRISQVLYKIWPKPTRSQLSSESNRLYYTASLDINTTIEEEEVVSLIQSLVVFKRLKSLKLSDCFIFSYANIEKVIKVVKMIGVITLELPQQPFISFQSDDDDEVSDSRKKKKIQRMMSID